MTKKRRQYSAEFKFKVALEAVKGRKTISELASERKSIRTRSVNGSDSFLRMDRASSIGMGAVTSRNMRSCRPNSSSKLGVSRWSWSG